MLSKERKLQILEDVRNMLDEAVENFQSSDLDYDVTDESFFNEIIGIMGDSILDDTLAEYLDEDFEDVEEDEYANMSDEEIEATKVYGEFDSEFFIKIYNVVKTNPSYRGSTNLRDSIEYAFTGWEQASAVMKDFQKFVDVKINGMIIMRTDFSFKTDACKLVIFKTRLDLL